MRSCARFSFDYGKAGKLGQARRVGYTFRPIWAWRVSTLGEHLRVSRALSLDPRLAFLSEGDTFLFDSRVGGRVLERGLEVRVCAFVVLFCDAVRWREEGWE